MRRQLPILLLPFVMGVGFSIPAVAQTPMGLRNVSGESEASANALPANSPWFGAQIMHRFGTKGEFDSNLLAAGQFVYEMKFNPGGSTQRAPDPTALPAGAPAVAVPGAPAAPAPAPAPAPTAQPMRFHLPIISNFGGQIGPDLSKEAVDEKVKKLLSSATGVTAGLFPYYEVGKNNNFMFTLHGLLAWRYNSFKAEPTAAASAGTDTNAGDAAAEVVPLHQVKAGMGFEIVIGDRSDGKGAMTVGVTPVITMFTDPDAYERAFGERRSSLGAAEVVAIVPLSEKGVGLVVELVAAGGGKSAVRGGLAFVGKPK
jgi:hypothetical protein